MTPKTDQHLPPITGKRKRKLLFGLEIEKKESRKPKRSSRAGTVRALQIDKMYYSPEHIQQFDQKINF